MTVMKEDKKDEAHGRASDEDNSKNRREGQRGRNFYLELNYSVGRPRGL
jgi:hypothetical protein